MTQTIEEIKKNNELFANSLTYMILGKPNFLKVLRKWGYDSNYINDYTKVIEKYIKDFTREIKNHLNNLK